MLPPNWVTAILVHEQHFFWVFEGTICSSTIYSMQHFSFPSLI